MFASSFRLPFRLAGIPLFIHISFLFVLPLMVWATSQNITMLVHQPQFGLDLPASAFTGPIAVVLGFIAVLGLFVSVVLHELGHSLTAQRYGVKVRRITLWFLGGVAEFEQMPRQRGAEAVVGIAGPIVSFVLAGIFWGLKMVIPLSLPALWVIVFYLAIINLMLGVFNLLPALPMDGGRILRSLLALKMPHSRATRIAGNVSKVLAIALGIYGVFFNWWMVVLALFVFTAVKNETQQGVVLDLLRGVGVSDVMTRGLTQVPAYVTVGQLSAYIHDSHHRDFPVVDQQGRLIGTIGLRQMQNVHPDTPVWQVMSTQIVTINQQASAMEAISQMARHRLEHLIVLDDAGAIAGMVSQSDLARLIEYRMANQQPPASNYIPPTPFSRYPPSAPVG